MSAPARQSDPPDDAPRAIQKARPAPAPVIINAADVPMDVGDSALARAAGNAAAAKLKLVDAPQRRTRRESAMVTGFRDLQQLQKQTIAVLEAVKGNLEDISQVLRSPEATRGMEKQQNAAALLAKGFATEAVIQAQGAVELLPANPDSHLLLSLSLAANQQFDDSLAAARKGIALFDRRTHPLAIEAGLLHAIAALGHGGEAAQRWHEIIDSLPLPVFLENVGRIAVCYPTAAPENQLDRSLSRRLVREADAKTADLPPASLFAALDAARDHKLPRTHRSILVRITLIARRLRSHAEILRFLGDYVVGLSERSHRRSADALARIAVNQLLATHADAPTLFRALLKLELAGTKKPRRYLAQLLAHWRSAGARSRRARTMLWLASLVFVAGSGVFAHAAAGLRILPAGPWGHVRNIAVEPLYAGIAGMLLGGAIATLALLRRQIRVELPCRRPRLSADELRFLRTREVKDALRRTL